MKNKVLVFSFLQFFLIISARYYIGPLIPVISKDLKIGLDLVGLTLALYSLILLFTSILTAVLIERFGLKKIFYIGISLNLLGILGFYFAAFYIIFILAFLFSALGNGITRICIMSLSSLDQKSSMERTRTFLQIFMGGGIAMIIAPLLVSFVTAKEFSWRSLYLIFLLVQLILFIFLTFIKIPEKPLKQSIHSLKAYLNFKILMNPEIMLCLFAALLASSIYDTFYSWFTSYYSAINISLNLSSIFLAFFSLAFLLGIIIKNFLVKYLREKILLLLNASLSLVFLTLAFFSKGIIQKNIFIFLFGFSFAGHFALILSIAIKSNFNNINAISGFIHGGEYFGIFIFQLITGYLSENFSRSSVFYLNIILLFILVILISALNMRRCMKKNIMAFYSSIK